MLLALTVTGLSGLFLLVTWLAMAGPQSDEEKPPQRPNAVVFAHVTLATISFVLWLFYVVLHTSALALTTAVVLVAVVILGTTVFVRWFSQSRDRVDAPRPEHRLPVAAVAIHGVLAVLTSALVVVAVRQI